MSADAQFLLRTFATACALLNGDLAVPSGPRRAEPPRRAPSARSSDAAATLGALARVRVSPRPWDDGCASAASRSEDARARDALYRRYAPDGVTRGDALHLLALLREQYRYHTTSPVRAAAFADSALPHVRAQWPPPRTPDEWRLASEWLQHRAGRLADLVTLAGQWFGVGAREALLFSALQTPPRTSADAYTCLLVAATYPDNLSGRPDPILRPCLACPRFFIATRRNRETCSDACRQRLYRGTQDEVRRAELRRDAAQYQRAHRQKEAKRKRQAALAAKASRTSRPPRRTDGQT